VAALLDLPRRELRVVGRAGGGAFAHGRRLAIRAGARRLRVAVSPSQVAADFLGSQPGLDVPSSVDTQTWTSMQALAGLPGTDVDPMWSLARATSPAASANSLAMAAHIVRPHAPAEC
jgi:hypothetical protein